DPRAGLRRAAARRRGGPGQGRAAGRKIVGGREDARDHGEEREDPEPDVVERSGSGLAHAASETRTRRLAGSSSRRTRVAPLLRAASIDGVVSSETRRASWRTPYSWNSRLRWTASAITSGAA